MAETARGILIVDDEPPLLRMMSMYLGRIGYKVTIADGLEKARAALAASPHGFAIIVLDASIAGSTIDQFAGEILAADPNVRLIGASGYPVDMSGLEGLAPGRVAFLHKPFSPQMLAATVRRMLASEESL